MDVLALNEFQVNILKSYVYLLLMVVTSAFKWHSVHKKWKPHGTDGDHQPLQTDSYLLP